MERKTTCKRVADISRKHLSISFLRRSCSYQWRIIHCANQSKSKRQKGSIMALIAGTKAETVIEHIRKIDEKLRKTVTEITLDMANSMKLIAKKCFSNATQVIDRFHVQKLALEALQELRITHRWTEMDNENIQLKKAKKNLCKFIPEILSNGDTKKQLLARSRYLLYKCKSKWTRSQQERASLLFELYPDIKKA